jgi:hypothetical protein
MLCRLKKDKPKEYFSKGVLALSVKIGAKFHKANSLTLS